MTISSVSLQLLAVSVLLCVSRLSAFAPSSPKCRAHIALQLAEPTPDGGEDEESAEYDDDDDQPLMQTGTVTMDDGGSDLTNRFKYKVNALMGVFDPQVGEDDERQDGNILNAMLTFPTQFTFNAVGRTSGEDSLKEEYVEQVKETVSSLAGDEVDFKCQITPRGKSFTRVSIQVKVDSAAVISSIYDELGKMEMTVMKY
jgi:putative lipoic acid-binding regulatory protein